MTESINDLPIGAMLLYCTTSKGNPSDCVEWAEVALCKNFDTPSLRILAGLNPPLNSFEVKSYSTAALKELGIDIPPASRAISIYAIELAQEIIQQPKTIRSNTKKLFQLCIDHDYRNDIYTFYLLYFALTDLDHKGIQYYWQDATEENIEAIIINNCHEYIKKNDT
jgi:hypothetical protein